jgi:Arc/MetJ-type ribon-helix-helix transcriptional regulator
MYFEKRVSVRFTEEKLREIESFVDEDEGETYEGVGHFIRSAVIKVMREENLKRGKNGEKRSY